MNNDPTKLGNGANLTSAGQGECEVCGQYVSTRVEGGAGNECTVCYCDGIGHGSQGEYTLAETEDHCEQALGRKLTGRESAMLAAYSYAKAV